MNTTFEKNSNFNSNNRIFEGYFEEPAKAVGTLRRGVDSFLYIIISVITAMTSAKAIALYKVFGVACSLVGFIGVIGAVERGSLGFGAGLLIGAVLIGVEYLCLRPRRS